MSERNRNVIVGLTTLLGLLGVVALIMIFGYMPSILRSGYVVQINLPRAGGLHDSSVIYLSGIPVGQVERIDLREPAGVTVYARIQDHVRIPQQVRAVVTQPLIGGSATVELTYDPEQAGEVLYYTPGSDTVIEGEIPSLGASMNQVVGNLERVSQNFERLSVEWTKVGASINALVELRNPEAVDNGEGVGNLATVLQRTDRRLAELEEVLAGINRYTGDEALRTNISEAAANVRAVTDKAAAGIEAVQQRYVAVADRLSVAVDAIRDVAVSAREGDGTLGKLLHDPSLYQNLNDATERLQATLDEAKLLIQKWKAEGVPVQF